MSETEKLGYGYKYKQVVKGKIEPLHDKVMVEEMQFGMQTTSKGLIILNNDGSNHGIKSRWAKVHAVGPKQEHVQVGQYVLVEHGRWTRGVELVDPESGETATIRMVDNDNILAVSDTPMEDSAIGSKTGA